MRLEPLSPAETDTHDGMAGLTEKRCPGCDQRKGLDQFGRNAARADGRQVRCRACRSPGPRPRVEGDPRRRQTLAAYGLTIETFQARLDAQDGRCAVCRTDDPGDQWHVDHDHECCPERRRSCGQCLRGILCHGCNVGLGHLGDDPARLRAAADYLERAASHRLNVLGSSGG